MKWARRRCRPYIKRAGGSSETDKERYQTHVSREKEARSPRRPPDYISHPPSCKLLRDRGARVAEITLHVGYGTFEPVRVDEIESAPGDWPEFLTLAAAGGK